MKNILAAVLLGTALSLTACGGSDDPAPRETVYVQPDGGTNGGGQSSVEQEFLYDISLYNTPELEAQSDADLIELGQVICDAFDEGASLRDIVRVGMAGGDGLSQDSLVTVAAAAVVNFCPEFSDRGGIGT